MEKTEKWACILKKMDIMAKGAIIINWMANPKEWTWERRTMHSNGICRIRRS